MNDVYAVELVIHVALTNCFLHFINAKHPSVLGASNLPAMSKEKRTYNLEELANLGRMRNASGTVHLIRYARKRMEFIEAYLSF